MDYSNRMALATAIVLAVVLTIGIFAVAGASPAQPNEVVVRRPTTSGSTSRDVQVPMPGFGVAALSAPSTPPRSTLSTPPTLPPSSSSTPPKLPRSRASTPSTIPRTAPPVGAPATRAPAVATNAAPDFALVGYRWNPCRVISVTSTGPDITAVVSELSTITGLNLQLVTGPAQITVGWGPVAGNSEIGQSNWIASNPWFVQVTVTISPAATPHLQSVLRHELGHAMGLDHAKQRNEIMYPVIGSGSPTDYQAGDLAGLRAVGASAGC